MNLRHDSSPETPPPAVVIKLQRPPIWSSALTMLVTIAAAFCASTLLEFVPRVWRGTALSSDVYELAAVLGFWTVIIGGALGKRWLVRLRPVPPIVFHDQHIILPRGAESFGSQKVAYDDIMAVHEGGRPPRRQFFIESKQRVFHLPQEIFCELSGPETLFVELRRRILNLPQGTALLEETEKKRFHALQALTKKPLVTQAILGTIGVFFLNCYLKGALDSPFGLLRWGANAPALVREGDWYRLIAANFLHSSFLHVFMNGMALFYLGNLLERLLCWPRLLIIYTVCGLIATSASAMASVSVMSVGASGAIFGLLGGFAVVSWRLKAQLPLGLRQPIGWWVFMLVVNTLLPLLWPMVDITAHLAGFISGIAITLVLLGRQRRLPNFPGRALQIASLALAGVFAAGLATAVYHAAHAKSAEELQFASVVIRDPHTGVNALNDMAWAWAIDPESSADELEKASQAAQLAVERAPQIAAYLDTAATVAWRLGNWDGAIDAERRAVDLAGDEALFATQLARFLTSRLQAKKAPILHDFGADEVAIEVSPEGDLVLAKMPRRSGGSEVYALVSRDDRQIALLHVRLGAQISTPLRYKPTLLGDWRGREPLRVDLAWVGPSATHLNDGAAQWRLRSIASRP